MRWLIPFAVLVIGVLLWSIVNDPAVDDPPPRTTAVKPPTPAESPPPPDPERTIAGASDQPEEAERVALETPMQTIRGRVVVGFEDSPPVLDASGSFGLRTEVEEVDYRETVEVRDGRFEVEVPAGGRVFAWKAVLDNKPANLESSELFPDGQGFLELRALWNPLIPLSVLDAATGLDLADVTVSRRHATGNGCRMLPTPPQRPVTVVEKEHSPVGVPSDKARRQYWAGAPGYAWKSFALWPHSGSEEVRLQRAGALRVELTNHDPSWDAVVRVKRGAGVDGTDRGEIQVEKDGTALLEGMEPGDYRVLVEQGEWYNATVLGQAEATVIAGAQVRVLVPVQPPPDSDSLVPVRGTLLVRSGPFYRHVQLSLLPADEELRRKQAVVKQRMTKMTAVDGSPGELRFDLGSVLPGEYELLLSPRVYQETIRIGPAGREDLRIVCPVLHPLTVRLTSSGFSLDPLPPSLGLAWEGKGKRAHHFRTFRESTGNEYVTQVPEGEITVRFPRVREYWAEWGKQRVVPGNNVIELVVRQYCFARISLHQGGRPVNAEHSWRNRIRARPTQGGEQQMSQPFGQDPIEARFLHEGSYQLIFPSLSGYLQIEPIEVFLIAGQTVDVSVPVVAR